MIWCPYRMNGRSHMSNSITLAERSYAAELAHSERVRSLKDRRKNERRAPKMGARGSLRSRQARRPDEASATAAGPDAGAPRAGAHAATFNGADAPEPSSERRRWIALGVLCLGQL